MLHPQYLQEVYNQCVQLVTSSLLPCETILQAQADFTVLENQREQDAERFGAQILQAQENSIFLRSKYKEVWESYNALGKEPHTVEQLKDKRLELDRARINYDISNDKVQVLLVVVAVTSRM